MKRHERKFICLEDVRAVSFLKGVLRLITTSSWVLLYRYQAESEDGLLAYDIMLVARKYKGYIEFKQIIDEVSMS